jgi:hypothetical protein
MCRTRFTLTTRESHRLPQTQMAFTEAINLSTLRMHLKILWGDAVRATPVRSSIEAAVAETT